MEEVADVDRFPRLIIISSLWAPRATRRLRLRASCNSSRIVASCQLFLAAFIRYPSCCALRSQSRAVRRPIRGLYEERQCDIRGIVLLSDQRKDAVWLLRMRVLRDRVPRRKLSWKDSSCAARIFGRMSSPRRRRHTLPSCALKASACSSSCSVFSSTRVVTCDSKKSCVP